jgi:DNA repair protein RadC
MELHAKNGSGYRPALPHEICEVAAKYHVAEREGKQLTSPRVTREFLKKVLAGRDDEVFVAVFMDTRHRVITTEELFHGTIDAAHIHPRVVVKKALEHNAASLIICHNHPSGVAEPSQADMAITRRLRDGLGLVDIRLLDHFIVGDAEVVSMAERCLI